MYTYVIVDDEPLIRKGSIKKLEPLASQITCVGEAGNGAEALDVIAKEDPDIIITDMYMPVLSGAQLLLLLTEKYSKKRIIVISGYKDFDYLKHAITANAVDYILKPFSKSDLQNSVLNAIKQIETSHALENRLVSSEENRERARYEYDIQMLKNLILGYHTNAVNIISERLKFINDTHDLILMTMHSELELDENLQQQFLSENGFGDLAIFLQHTQHNNLGFFILFIPENMVLSPDDLCKQIIRSLSRMFNNIGQNVSYGISLPQKSLLNLHDSFLETVAALNAKQLKDENSYYFYDKDKVAAKSIVWDKTDEFLFRIEAGMKEEAAALLNQLFQSLAEHSSCTLYNIKVFLFWLSDRTRHMMMEYLEQIAPGSAGNSIEIILNSMFSLDELKAHYLQFYSNITDTLKGISPYSIDDVTEKMKIYISRHYYNNITIEFLSSLFYMNRSYCSHLFKKRTGDTFVNYLNAVRLKQAKYLLTNSEKKIYQIAKSVGYDNVKYFFRVFKKKEGITPEQYRKAGNRS